MKTFKAKLPSRRGKHKRDAHIERYGYFASKFYNDMREGIRTREALKDAEEKEVNA